MVFNLMIMLDKKIKELVDTQVGQPVEYSRDMEWLSEEIFRKTHQRISTATLKRVYGLTSQKVDTRLSTLDIIARFLGYENYDTLAKELGIGNSVSGFTQIDTLNATDLNVGTVVEVEYDPDRKLVFTYVGDSRFRVDESYNSKLCVGDLIKVSALAKGFQLIATEVVRDGHIMGGYEAGKNGGLTSITILD